MKISNFTQKMILLFLFMPLSISVIAQVSEGYTKARIPKGQYIFSNDFLIHSELIPYQKQHTTIWNGTRTLHKEKGDFVFTESRDSNNVLQLDTVGFRISKMSITETDTLITYSDIEFRKKLVYDMKAQIKIGADKIYVKQEKVVPNTGLIVRYVDNIDIVTPVDKTLYFKMDDDEQFEIHSSTAGVSLINIPMKLRFGANSDSLGTSVTGNYKNIGLHLGFKRDRYIFKNNQLRKRSLCVGPFISFSQIRLDQSNSSLQEGEVVKQLGFNVGIGVVSYVNRFNMGVVLGVESSTKDENYDWNFHRSVYLGLVLGFSLN